MVILDANMILRYLLNDHQEMANQAEQILNTGNAFVTLEVAAEVVYVLKSVYALERVEIAETLKGFLELVDCHEMDVLKLSLDTFAKYKLDFVDCILYGYHSVKGIQVATFDKKLAKLIAEK
jgi:predicted nucleic-acid-binding protein